MDLVVNLLQGIAVAAFGAAMLYAAVSDLRMFEVPNWVSGIVVVGFLVTFVVSRLTRPPEGAAAEIDEMRKVVGGAFTRP